MHINSELLFRKHALGYFKPGMRVLEIGPDATPSTYYKCATEGELANDWPLQWDTADIKPLPPGNHTGTPMVLEDPYWVPVDAETYDVVVTGQVIQYVTNVRTWISDLARVCRMGGQVIIIGPISWPQDAPFDKWRIFPDGMRTLYHFAGLDADLSIYESLDGDKPTTCLYCGNNTAGCVDCITIGTKR